MHLPAVIVRASAVVVVCAGLAPRAVGQCQPWVELANTGPSQRQNHAMAAMNDGVYLFGGFLIGVGFNAETWKLDSVSGEPAWEQVIAPGPSARGNFGFAYDSARQRIVLFGGAGTGGAMFGDTWAFDGTTWTDLAPATAPTQRINHAMAYDAARDRIVMFGGFGSARFNQTWLFDGTTNTWTQAAPATVPIARNGHAMVYDASRQRVVMFGGYRGGSIASIASFLADTWEWDGVNWTQSPATGPAARQYLSMAYDAANGVTVLAGGSNINSTKLSDTWTFDGTAWTQLTDVGIPGVARDQHTMTFDEMTLLHGGYAGGGAGGVRTDTMALSCPPNACDGDVNCDFALDGFDVEVQEKAVGGDVTDYCQPDPDFNGDFALDGFDVEAVEVVVGGGPCP